MTQEESNHSYPFTAVVGQDELKLALLLNVIDPSIGGVLAVGDKGTGKTTLIRSLASLMNQEAYFPFINLPIGASEDRVLGHVNLEKLINDKKEEVQLGLLAKANSGFLYVDEINLLNDYLMDVLLDASSTGYYHLEREGVSCKLASRFCLIGSMNPEEGQLRPQLKDRFGLSVNIRTPQDAAMRARIVQHRLAFDDNPEVFSMSHQMSSEKLLGRVLKAKELLKTIQYTEEMVNYCAKLALAHQVEGVRADVLLLKTARSFAALEGDHSIAQRHVDHIAAFVLNHRSNQKDHQQDRSQEPDNQPNEQRQRDEENESPNESKNQSQVFAPTVSDNELNASKAFQKGTKRGIDAHLVNSHAPSVGQVNVGIDVRKTVGQYLATDQLELQEKKRQIKSSRHWIFILDSSGSMMQSQIVAYGKGLIEQSVLKHQFDKLSFSLITLFDGNAQVCINSTQDVAYFLQKLKDIQTGGKTNMLAAFKKVKEVTSLNLDCINELVVVTDGKFSEVHNEAEVYTIYQTYCKAIHQLTLVDAEQGVVKLNLVKELAKKLNGNYQQLKGMRN